MRTENAGKSIGGCIAGLFMVPLVLVAATAGLLVKLFTFRWARRSDLMRLGLQFSTPSGFRDFEWATPMGEVLGRLGAPLQQKEENGITSLHYCPKSKLFGGGIHSEIYLFFEGKLIAGESVALGVVPDQYRGAFNRATRAITEYCRQYTTSACDARAAQERPDVLVWVLGATNTRFMLHRHELSVNEAMIALTVDDGRQDNEIGLLKRYEK